MVRRSQMQNLVKSDNLASAKRELLASFKHNVEGKFLKSDLNRNVVAQSCEEDEDEEELDVN